MLSDIDISPEEAVNLLTDVTYSPESQQRIRALKDAAGGKADALERALLRHAARKAVTAIDSLPLHPAVITRLRRELTDMGSGRESHEVGSSVFVRAAYISTLRRFTAGPMEWDLSGLPRSYFLKTRLFDVPKLLSFVAFKVGAFKPYFHVHVAPKPRNRALVVSKEVDRAYYRIARSLELQPDIRAIIGTSWFHDPVALADNPHLEALNAPIRDHGGFITTLGIAPLDSGFVEGDVSRRWRFESGELKYRIGLAIWPRAAAVAWAASHPELDT